ncbi:hypothetical protein [Novispirillum itersonii]|uniref:hypothetical protein n=1 Tax=Novispirillum itersonii TaxID=189 RepID=UPI0012DBCD1F|nr:hypothetical protein [Novispirillum itersonii]
MKYAPKKQEDGTPLTVRHPISGEVLKEVDLDQLEGIERAAIKRLIASGDLVPVIENKKGK